MRTHTSGRCSLGRVVVVFLGISRSRQRCAVCAATQTLKLKCETYHSRGVRRPPQPERVRATRRALATRRRARQRDLDGRVRRERFRFPMCAAKIRDYRCARESHSLLIGYFMASVRIMMGKANTACKYVSYVCGWKRQLACYSFQYDGCTHHRSGPQFHCRDATKSRTIFCSTSDTQQRLSGLHLIVLHTQIHTHTNVPIRSRGNPQNLYSYMDKTN